MIIKCFTMFIKRSNFQNYIFAKMSKHVMFTFYGMRNQTILTKLYMLASLEKAKTNKQASHHESKYK